MFCIFIILFNFPHLPANMLLRPEAHNHLSGDTPSPCCCRAVVGPVEDKSASISSCYLCLLTDFVTAFDAQKRCSFYAFSLVQPNMPQLTLLTSLTHLPSTARPLCNEFATLQLSHFSTRYNGMSAVIRAFMCPSFDFTHHSSRDEISSNRAAFTYSEWAVRSCRGSVNHTFLEFI